ncbi:MAG: hypothetical protein LBG59_01505 [Candidatus Peribacteria bacterium]|jgi:lysophospholipase L1-like esterase|nr:hypothetical protein [Candidatus Peribacteria bacterium]
MQSFVASGVEIVSIMLGTNDSRIDDLTTIEIYRTRMQTLINNLKTNGIKKIILNEPPYVVSGAYNNASRGEGSHTKLLGFIDVLDEVSDGEMVIRGDTQAYEYFEANQIELTGNLSN